MHSEKFTVFHRLCTPESSSKTWANVAKPDIVAEISKKRQRRTCLKDSTLWIEAVRLEKSLVNWLQFHEVSKNQCVWSHPKPWMVLTALIPSGLDKKDQVKFQRKRVIYSSKTRRKQVKNVGKPPKNVCDIIKNCDDLLKINRRKTMSRGTCR